MAKGPKPRTPDQVRAHILASVVIDDNGCWTWQGKLSVDGYARLNWKPEQTVIAFGHRVSYTVFVGPIADGFSIDHLCRNRACVRPGHLDVVTAMENVWASGITVAVINGTKTRCPAGHLYTPENTYLYGPRNTWRLCRICQRNHQAVSRRRSLKAVSA